MRLFTLITAIVALVAVTGCATKDYYRDKAAEKARSFALEKLQDLSPEVRCHLRIARPHLYEKTYMKDKQFSQVCYVWDPPTMKGFSVVVFGTCGANYSDWVPVRAIVKKFEDEKQLE